MMREHIAVSSGSSSESEDDNYEISRIGRHRIPQRHHHHASLNGVHPSDPMNHIYSQTTLHPNNTNNTNTRQTQNYVAMGSNYSHSNSSHSNSHGSQYASCNQLHPYNGATPVCYDYAHQNIGKQIKPNT